MDNIKSSDSRDNQDLNNNIQEVNEDVLGSLEQDILKTQLQKEILTQDPIEAFNMLKRSLSINKFDKYYFEGGEMLIMYNSIEDEIHVKTDFASGKGEEILISTQGNKIMVYRSEGKTINNQGRKNEKTNYGVRDDINKKIYKHQVTTRQALELIEIIGNRME